MEEKESKFMYKMSCLSFPFAKKALHASKVPLHFPTVKHVSPYVMFCFVSTNCTLAQHVRQVSTWLCKQVRNQYSQ